MRAARRRGRSRSRWCGRVHSASPEGPVVPTPQPRQGTNDDKDDADVLRRSTAELSLQPDAEKRHLDNPDRHGGESRSRNAEYPVPAYVTGSTRDMLYGHERRLAVGQVSGHRLIQAMAKIRPALQPARSRPEAARPTVTN